MIDLEKSKIEAEALAKLRKEQYFREVLAGELGVMIDQHFASKEPLREILPVFCTALKDLAICAREIFDYLEGLQEVAPEEPEPAAEEPELLTALKEAAYRDVNKMMGITAAEPDPEKAPSAAAVKVSNERIEQLQAEGLSPTQIAKVRRREAEAKPRTLTADLISDEELEEEYFKRGKTIKQIADELNIKPYGLYKRIEAMRDKRQDIAKECASSQQ